MDLIKHTYILPSVFLLSLLSMLGRRKRFTSDETNFGFSPITCLPVDIFTAPVNSQQQLLVKLQFQKMRFDISCTCLFWRQFAWNSKVYFLGKIRSLSFVEFVHRVVEVNKILSKTRQNVVLTKKLWIFDSGSILLEMSQRDYSWFVRRRK